MRIDPPFGLVERAARLLFERQQRVMADRAARNNEQVMMVPWANIPESDRQKRLQGARVELECILRDQEDAVVDMVRQIADVARSAAPGSSGTSCIRKSAANEVDRHQTTRPG